MPRAKKKEKFVTLEKLAENRKEVEQIIANETKKIKKWDVKQDKKLLKKKKK